MKTIWSQAEKQLKNSPCFIYDGAPKPKGQGFIASNEADHFKMRVPGGKGQALLGFGSTVNWDIAFRRKNSFLILADSSIDVMLAHFALYRPLFLAAESPNDFLDILSGRRNLEGDECEFARQALVAPSVLFKNIKLERPLPEMFRCSFNAKVISKLTRIPSLFIWPSRFSFLGSFSNYKFVRNMYVEDRVRFALADIRDEKLYSAVAAELKRQGLGLTDIYVSNIPTFLEAEGGWSDSRMSGLWMPLIESKAFVYETRGADFPYQYATHVLSTP